MLEARTVTIEIDDGKVVSYRIRGLEEEEIGGWAAFCASVFSYKAHPPPASYFERHYYNDPRCEASLVRVALTEEDGKIVSSCRVFRKRLSAGAGGFAVEAGGIGEVCTDPAHRKRGLSKLLLQDAIEIMTNKEKMQISLLHAAPTFFPVYQRGGNYENTTSRWTTVSVATDRLESVTGEETKGLRLAEFPNDTPRLQALHQEYSERRFAGCVIRSTEYWNNYISKELDGSLWVLTDKDNTVYAWLSLRPRGNGRYQLREFGRSLEGEGNTRVDLSYLLKKALSDATENVITLHLPTMVLEEARGAEFLEPDSVATEDDQGWMYRSLQDDAVSMVEITQTIPHLIWPSDSF